jgi:hypothetical protein
MTLGPTIIGRASGLTVLGKPFAESSLRRAKRL